MAAVKLVTRCPACRTAFRLVADQLRLRQGLVRCGHCETVFDAREHLIEIPLPAGSAAPSAATTPAARATAAPAPSALSASAAAETAPAPLPAAAPPRPFTPFTPTIDPGYDVPALDAPTMLMSPDEMEAQADVPTAAPAQAGMDDDEIERAVREANEAVAHRDARDAERHGAAPAPVSEAAQPQVPAAAQAEPEAEAEIELEAEPEIEAEPGFKPEAESATASPAISIPIQGPPAPPVATPPWPALNHAALDMPVPAAQKPAAPASEDTTGDKPAAVPPVPPAVIPSASEFLRAASADAGPVPPARPTEANAAPTPTIAAGNDSVDDHIGANLDQNTGAPSLGTDFGDEAFSVTGGAVAREQTTRRWARTEAPAGPVFAPDFLRQARERERTRPPRTGGAVPRYVWHVAAVVLAIAATAQVVYLARSQLAGQFPTLRPVLEAACAPLRCEVPPWRDIDALRIETSQLQRQDESGDTYLLAVTLRNQGRASTVLPAIELVMTDLQDQLLLRRVLQPADYLEPTQKALAAQGLRAGMELPVRVRFRTQQAPANYRVLIFYP
ncbi:zinc-ribbon and DUF3426 domain-containing protein [Cupriavidus necator]